MKPQPRSGDHIIQRGTIWHYWRMIPPDGRPGYGKSAESKSLNTANRTEALHLAKPIDVELDQRILEIRAASDPDIVAKKLAEQAMAGYGPFRTLFSGDPSLTAYRSIRRDI